MAVLETDRLVIQRLTLEDAPFILRLLNDPDFHRFIGDRGVRNLDDARNYILAGPIASYEKHGFGLYLVRMKDTLAPIGMCGLLKREVLQYVDIGFAYMPEFRGQGYAYEAAAAVIRHAGRDFGIDRVAGVAKPHNASSIRLLQKLGMRLEGTAKIAEDGAEDVLYVGPTC